MPEETRLSNVALRWSLIGFGRDMARAPSCAGMICFCNATARLFYLRVHPSTDEMNNLIRVGAFDSFGESRTAQFWEFGELAQWPHVAGQGVLLGGEKPVLPQVPLSEPNRTELLKAETELLGFAVSGHRSICIQMSSGTPIVQLPMPETIPHDASPSQG